MTSKATGMGGQVMAWVKSPTGPTTTHFWGPVANFGIVAAGIADSGKPAEMISPNMTGVLCVYSALFMRWSMAIRPRNYLLLTCHAMNEVVQLNQLRRWYTGAPGAVAHAEASQPEPPALPPGIQQPPSVQQRGKTRVVVLGSGWGAIPFLKGLSKDVCNSTYDITVVSPRNYFLYTPLLPGAVTGTVESRSIVDPVRKYVSGKAEYFEAAAVDVDPSSQTVTCMYQAPNDRFPDERRRFTVPYDVLVFAVGSVTNDFGVPGVQEHAYFLKTLEDAKKLRKRVNQCFEMASLPNTNEEEKRKLLTFVVVGGGPTGTELAAELHDLVIEDMVTYFPKLKEFVSIRLIDTHDHILNTLDRALSAYATQQFQRSGIDLVLGCRVKGVEADKVLVQQAGADGLRQVEFGTCVWTTGIKMNPLTTQLCHKLPSGAQEHWRSLMTDPYLCVKGSHGTIFGIGDAATIAQEKALTHAAELFESADLDHDGQLSCHELLALMRKAKKQYPQLAEHAQHIQCGDVPMGTFGGFMRTFLSHKSASSYDNVIATQRMGDDEEEEERERAAAAAEAAEKAKAMAFGPDDKMCLDDFKHQLQTIDKGLRSLPATAQVANRQGKYLAELFNKHHIGSPECAQRGIPASTPPFKYKHLGTFVNIGNDQAVLDPSSPGGGLGPLQGLLIGWAWKGSETFMQISLKNMYLVSRDLLKAKLAGRDISDT